MRGTPKFQRDGFSLLEVLISLAVISIALLALLSVLSGGMKAQDKTSKHSLAHAVAEQTLERLSATLRANPSDHKAFWEGGSWDLPDELSQVTVDRTVFYCFVSSQAIIDKTTQEPLGGSPNPNSVARLVTMNVAWSQDSVKSGVGNQEISIRRIFSRSER